MKNTLLPPALLLVLTLAFVAAPALTPPFTGYAPGQLPVAIDRHFIQPAGYAFSIWGVIYLWLIAHAGFGLWQRKSDAAWAQGRAALGGSVALGVVWLAIALNWPILATVVIATMAVLAIAAYLAADPGQDYWLLAAPRAIYAGWLTAATTASLGILGGGYGLLSNAGAALAGVAFALVVGLVLQSRRPQVPLYGLTITWALVAIAAANRDAEQNVAMAALGAAGLLALGSLGLWTRARRA